MNIELITVEDLNNLKEQILEDLKKYIKTTNEEDTWLKTCEVKRILGCSEGTLVNLRSNGMLPYSKIKGTIYIN